MSELDELEADLRVAGDTWFRDELLVKLHRLIDLARRGEAAIVAMTIIDQKLKAAGLSPKDRPN